VKYYIDTEFIEDGKTIDLISIGIVCEDGREYYAINFDCDFSRASSWVKENVLAHLPSRPSTPGFLTEHKKAISEGWKNRSTIRDEVAYFLGCSKTAKSWDDISAKNLIRPDEIWEYGLKEGTVKPEFYVYYGDYDWVVFCQIFGTMTNLPKGFPMYCRDLMQECDRLAFDPKSVSQENEHNALADARWNKRLHDELRVFEAKQEPLYSMDAQTGEIRLFCEKLEAVDGVSEEDRQIVEEIMEEKAELWSRLANS